MQPSNPRWRGATLAALLAVLGTAPHVAAQDQTTSQDSTREMQRTQTQDRDDDQRQAPMYGSQLMTVRERNTYRSEMRLLKTEPEREAYRLKHHQAMQARARVQGITLPDEPMSPRPGMGPGPASGGMGGMGGSGGSGSSGGSGGKK